METTPTVVAPGPRGVPLLGNLPALRRDRLGFFVGAARAHGDLVALRFGPVQAHLFTHPDLARHVLQDHHANYVKQSPGFRYLRLVLGNGLLTSEGSFWLRQRRIAQPAFHRARLAGFGATMARAGDALGDRWAPHAAAGKALDVAAEMMRVTLEVVSATLFGADVTDTADVVAGAVSEVLAFINETIAGPFGFFPELPTPRQRRFRAAVATLDAVVYGIIERRRRSGRDEGDLLSMLMLARDEETGEAMTDRQLRDEVMTLFLAGHETTANALSWTWALLSRAPTVRRRLDEELAGVLGDRLPGAEDLPSLRYTSMVVQESLRLYPPAWMVSRRAVADDVVRGVKIPAGSLVFVSPYITHRHPDFWENPEGFDPERFAPERVASIPRFAWFPFGGGPRICIGNGFALMEAQLLLATLARRYRLDLVPGYVPEPEPTVTLRPRGGMPMHVRPR